MRFSFLLFLVLCALTLQTTAFNFLVIHGVKPDLVLVLVILNGFLRGPREGAFYGFAAGAIQDLALGGIFGLHTLTKMVAAILAGLGKDHLYRDNRIIAVFLTWVCTFVAQLIFYLLLLLVEIPVPFLSALNNVIIPSAFYNAVIALLIYGYFYRIYKKESLSYI